MACRNQTFVLPRANYGSTREVAEALARALQAGGYRRRQRALIAVRGAERGVVERMPWRFILEHGEDAESRRRVLQSVMQGPEIPEISHLIFCGSCQQSWFEHRYQTERFQLGSAGIYLCGDVAKIEMAYPQKGLSLAQLHARADELAGRALTAVELGQRLFYQEDVTRYDWRAAECWELHQGEVALSSVASSAASSVASSVASSAAAGPFVRAQGNWPPILYELERSIAALTRAQGGAPSRLWA